MAATFRAVLLEKRDDGQHAHVTDVPESDLMSGDVTVHVTHSSLNYKDGLALTGAAPVVRRWPMVPGIDLAGDVLRSGHPRVAAGDRVIVNGWGLGETHWGGYAERACVKAEWLTPLPEAFSPAQAMAIGTAGYTAMLSVLALEDCGLAPSSGPVLVTGAAGGVGSVAVALLAKLGFQVIASTGREEAADYLHDLGAAEIIPRAELSGPAKPLAKERWAGAVDAVGSHTLANALAGTRYGGAVAACGLAQGMDLPGSVAPFILRGVTLCGIDSVYAPQEKRRQAWSRLEHDLDTDKLTAMTTTVPLDAVIGLAPDIVAGKVRGRTVVETGT